MRSFFVLGFLLFAGCASIYSPNFRSYKQTDCDPVLSVHIPQNVAYASELMEGVAKHPSLADKLFPASTMVGEISSNGASIGTGTAAVVSAVTDNMTLGSILSSATLGGVQAITGARSEDRTQDRVDVCMPKDAKTLYFKSEDHELKIEKECSNV